MYVKINVGISNIKILAINAKTWQQGAVILTFDVFATFDYHFGCVAKIWMCVFASEFYYETLLDCCVISDVD